MTEWSRAARTGREPCRSDGLPFETAQVDDRRGLAGYVRQCPCPPFCRDEDRRTLDDARAGREIGCRLAHFRADPRTDHALGLDTLRDPFAKLAHLAVLCSARDRDGNAVQARIAEARGEMLSHSFHVVGHSVRLVYDDELSRKARRPSS